MSPNLEPVEALFGFALCGGGIFCLVWHVSDCAGFSFFAAVGVSCLRGEAI